MSPIRFASCLLTLLPGLFGMIDAAAAQESDSDLAKKLSNPVASRDRIERRQCRSFFLVDHSASPGNGFCDCRPVEVSSGLCPKKLAFQKIDLLLEGG